MKKFQYELPQTRIEAAERISVMLSIMTGLAILISAIILAVLLRIS